MRPVLRVDALYGLRGIRVGEATNPGPLDVVTQSSTVVDALEFDLTQREVVVDASHPNPSQEGPTQWDLTARDAETEDEQSDTASCMSTDPAEGRVVSVIGANLERVPSHAIDALQEDLQFPGGTDDWFSFLRMNVCQVTTRSNPLQSILQPILCPIQGILPV